MHRNLNNIHGRQIRSCPLKLWDQGRLVWNAWYRRWNAQAQEWYFAKFDLGDAVFQWETTRIGDAIVHVFILDDGSEIWTTKIRDRWILLVEEEIRRAEEAMVLDGIFAV